MIRLAVRAADDAEAVLRLLPIVQAVQWDRSTAGRGDQDSVPRRVAGTHSDPTADTATDPARLYLREVLTRGEPHLADAAVRLGGLRRGLERALRRWEGPETDDAAPAV